MTGMKEVERRVKSNHTYTQGRLKTRGKGTRMKYNVGKTYLTPITRGNLVALSALRGISWQYIDFFKVAQSAPYSSYRNLKASYDRIRWSILVTGIDRNDNWWVFWRRETQGPASGQTLLYYEGSYPIQVSKVLMGGRHPKWPRSIDW